MRVWHGPRRLPPSCARRAGKSKAVQLAGGYCSLADAELAGDGLSRQRIVAGDHDHADAGPLCLCDGRRRLGARRIDECLQAQEHHAVLDLVIRLTGKDLLPARPSTYMPSRCSRLTVSSTAWQCHHPMASAAPDESRRYCGPGSSRCALGVGQQGALVPVNRRHHFALGAERDLTHFRITGPLVRGVKPGQLGRTQQRSVNRIARISSCWPSPLVASLHSIPARNSSVIPRRSHRLRHGHELSTRKKVLYRHRILRERAGLVGADGVHRAKRLDDGQAPDNGPARCMWCAPSARAKSAQ